MLILEHDFIQSKNLYSFYRKETQQRTLKNYKFKYNGDKKESYLSQFTSKNKKR